MRLPDDVRFATFRRAALTVFLSLGLSACGVLGGGSHDSGLASASDVPSDPAQRANGPAADYPILVGEPYRVGDVEYVPTETLNYDHVGYITTDQGAMGYSGAHHTLPIPSYAEVTSLETGRTILIRLNRRGPMSSNHLVALSPAAMAQLGAGPEAPVRMRRVNPPEAQRFMLRAGEAAPLRMDTPNSLLTVLQRRLPQSGAASLRAANTAPTAAPAATRPSESAMESVELAASEAAQSPVALEPVEAPTPLPRQISTPVVVAAAPAPAAPVASPGSPPALPPLDAIADSGEVIGTTGPSNSSFAEAFAAAETPVTVAALPPARSAPVAASTPQLPPAVEVPSTPAPAPPSTVEAGFVVQAAAFSSRERAERVANVIGGQITTAGRFFRVRTGPFATRGEAEASLANVRRAGYSDARIFTSG